MKRVFVSHPFANNPELNKIRADRICKALYKQGVLPISPIHLFAFLPDERCREDIMQVCFRLIDFCDQVNVYGDSPGTQAEVRYAWSVGKPVVDCTVSDWNRYMRERSEVTI